MSRNEETREQHYAQTSERRAEYGWESRKRRWLFWHGLADKSQILLFLMLVPVVVYAFLVAKPELDILHASGQGSTLRALLIIAPYWWPLLVPFLACYFFWWKAENL